MLRVEAVDLAELIERTMKGYGPVLGSVTLHTSLIKGWVCRIDPAQFSEALGNIAANALEAMNGEGELLVQLSESKRELIVEIKDTGPGLSKSEAAKVLEPFYTTKSGSDINFGLGLPYAYHVMRKHKGMLNLRSKPGVGTSVFLIFAKRAVQAERTDAVYAEGSTTND